MRKLLFLIAILTTSLFFFSCKRCDCPEASKVGGEEPPQEKVLSLYEALNGGIDSLTLAKNPASIKTKRIGEEEAKKDISAFFTGLRVRNPDMKCYVDIKDLQDIVTSMRANSREIDGIRIYTAQYTSSNPQERQVEGKFHYILVPLSKEGREIKEISGTSSIFNYNNDCPYSCQDIEKASLITSDEHRRICTNSN